MQDHPQNHTDKWKILVIATENYTENICPEFNNCRLLMPRQCIMSIEQCTHMLCRQTTWFMFLLTQAPLGGIPEWCIPLILTWDCVIGKTGLVRCAQTGISWFPQKHVLRYVHTGASHVLAYTLSLRHSSDLQSDGRIVTAPGSLCSHLGFLLSGQALAIVVPVLPNFTITFTPQKAPLTPQ